MRAQPPPASSLRPRQARRSDSEVVECLGRPVAIGRRSADTRTEQSRGVHEGVRVRSKARAMFGACGFGPESKFIEVFTGPTAGFPAGRTGFPTSCRSERG